MFDQSHFHVFSATYHLPEADKQALWGLSGAWRLEDQLHAMLAIRGTCQLYVFLTLMLWHLLTERPVQAPVHDPSTFIIGSEAVCKRPSIPPKRVSEQTRCSHLLNSSLFNSRIKQTIANALQFPRHIRTTGSVSPGTSLLLFVG